MGRMTTIMALVASSSLLAGLLVACGDDGEPAPSQTPERINHPLPGDPVAGEAIYKRICIACHAADGRGNGGLTGGDFSDPSRLNKSNAELLHSIAEGRLDKTPPMPAQKEALTEQERKDALSYIRREFGGARP